uniref:Uncharacterized protein n=1 Tax=Aegilops tauschii subsp. strangulata TaxID=200361 RepID=A0A453DG99_AEGTS
GGSYLRAQGEHLVLRPYVHAAAPASIYIYRTPTGRTASHTLPLVGHDQPLPSIHPSAPSSSDCRRRLPPIQLTLTATSHSLLPSSGPPSPS